MSDLARRFSGVALLAVLMIAAVRVQAERERRYPAAEATQDALYLTSGPLVRRVSLAYSALAADLYWIRAVQYYGGTKRRIASPSAALVPPFALAADRDAAYPLLYPLLDLTTTLDPLFNVA